MTRMSFPSAFIGNPFSYIQYGMDSRLRGNDSFWTYMTAVGCKRHNCWMQMTRVGLNSSFYKSSEDLIFRL